MSGTTKTALILLTIIGGVILLMSTGIGQSVAEKIAAAIQAFEGWTAGSRSFRNNNPGNLKGGSWAGVTGKDGQGFLIFATYQDGWRALVAQIEMALENTSSVYNNAMTLYEFFSRYAPSTDNNNPAQYASFVANRLGVSPDTILGDIV